jgi:hypothetical protein
MHIDETRRKHLAADIDDAPGAALDTRRDGSDGVAADRHIAARGLLAAAVDDARVA